MQTSMPGISQFDHVAVEVADLERSAEFYRSVLGLAAIPRPAFKFPGAWFRLGEVPELHLIVGTDKEHGGDRRGNHYALRVEDTKVWEKRLRDMDMPFHGPGQRPDGFFQIYVDDPGGNVIELCAAP